MLGFEIPEAHPRLLFSTPALLAQARTYYADHPTSPDDNDALGLAFRGLMTEDAAACRRAIARVVESDDYRLSDAYEEAVSSDHARWIGEDVILTYDWCHAHLTPGEANALRVRWNQYMRVLLDKPWGGEGMTANNYYWGYTRNALEWGITTWGENVQEGEDMARAILERAYVVRLGEWFAAYDAVNGVGGVPGEGTQYGRYMLGYATVPFRTLAALGADPFERFVFFRHNVYHLLYASLPRDTLAPPARREGCTGRYRYLFPHNDDETFFDCWPEALRRTDYGAALATIASRYADTPLGGHARYFMDDVDVEVPPWIAAVSPLPEAIAPTDLPLDYYAAGAQNLYGRTAWSEDATVFALHFGSPAEVGHRHLEAGSFQLWRDGAWLSRESTAYTDLYVSYDGGAPRDGLGAFAHNVVLFEGEGELTSADGPPIMLRLDHHEDYAYAAVDLFPAYRAFEVEDRCRYDWPYAKSVVREAIFVRGLEALVIVDRLEAGDEALAFAAEGACPGTHGFTAFPSEAGGERVVGADAVRKAMVVHFAAAPTDLGGGRFTATEDGQALDVFSFGPAGTVRRVIDERGGDASSNGQHRLEVEHVGAGVTHFVTVLVGRGAGDASIDVTVQQEDGRLRIFLDGAVHDAFLELPEGATVGYGTLMIDGDVLELHDGIRAMHITNAGPAWE